METLILITGVAGSGKSTVAEYIEKRYGYKEYALGDKLKELTYRLLKTFDVPVNLVDDLYDVNTKCKYRKYLQLIGTECMRGTFGDDFWSEQLNNVIKNENKAIISDVRFINEYNYFKSRYKRVYTIKVVRPGLGVMNHKSEQEIGNIPFDYIIMNELDLETLYHIVDNIMNFIQ